MLVVAAVDWFWFQHNHCQRHQQKYHLQWNHF